MTTEEPKHVCHTCITDEFLSKQVEKEGAQEECTYCRATRPAFTLADLSYRINEVVKDQFIPVPESDVPEQFRQGLYDNQILIEKVAGLNQDIAATVREYLLKERAWTVDVEREEKNAYSNEFLYEERQDDTSDLHSAWWDFEEEIRSRNRFFGANAVSALERVFKILESLGTTGDKPLTRKVNPGETDSTFWRARTAHSAWEIKPIIESLSGQLGPPPSEKAKAGRMNAEGIPVFYGALEEETCVSEIRAPVGSYVVLVKFDLLNPIHVLDLTELSHLDSNFSHFDPNYIKRRRRMKFLQELIGEMSRPVMPHEEPREYIATQIVSEYLANRFEPRLHGIIFNSAQTGTSGHNVVLFNSACSVEAYKPPPGTSIGFRVGIPLRQRIPPRGTESSQGSVIKTEPQRAVGETEPSVEDPTNSRPENQGSHRDNMLRLDPQSLKVIKISRVKYEFEPLRLNRDYHVSADPITWTFDIPPAQATIYRRNQDGNYEPEEPVK